MAYLTEQMKSNMLVYKYSVVDTSPLAVYVMHPFWNWFAQFYPKWVAPNLLTFFGFLLTVLHFILIGYFNPDFHDPDAVPSSVWFVSGLLVFTAHTLDGTDGKQARRTHSSSFLGELFDHGCDSWVCLFLPCSAYSLFCRSFSGAELVFIHWSVLLCFMLPHWEKYITGIFFLPWSYDVCQLMMATVFFIASVVKPGYFESFTLFGLSVPRFLALLAFVISFCLQIPCTIGNILKGRQGSIAWHRGLGTWEAFRPLSPTLLLCVFSLIWTFWSPTYIVDKNPRLFIYCFSTIASNTACHLIVAQMSRTRGPFCNTLVWLYGFCVLSLCCLLPIGFAVKSELPILWILAVWTTLIHLKYGVNFTKELASHLGIHVFSVQKRENK